MQLSLQNFSTLVDGMAAAVQATASQFLDLTVGSVLRAILEASASIALWMQWLILQVLQMTRASTSSGADLDSWMADFSLTRLPAVSSSGSVTFSRFTTTAAALVPTGVLVRTSDGSQTFAVAGSPSAAGWDPTLGGYVLGIGVPALDIPVIAQSPGAAGNVQAEAINTLATAIAGIDQVSNPEPFGNGLDAEADQAFRLRFQTYVASLSRATVGAIENAVVSAQQGLTYTIQENVSADGSSRLGNFIVVVDDGSGYPSNGLLASIYAGIQAVRPVGSTFSVLPPTVTEANISLSVTVSATSAMTTVIPLVTSATASYINALPVGTGLPASRVVQLAYDASEDVVNVTAVLLNGTPEDLSISPFGIVKAGTIVVS